MDKPIGIFDSGVGGLTVLAALKKQLPQENIIYIGDNVHCPYGDKTKEQLLSYTKDICNYFISQNVKMIVLACNTTSANVLTELQGLYPQVPIIGVIHSTVHDFLNRDKKSVLIIATHATVQSHKYKEIITHFNEDIKVYELETPLLVPLIEAGSPSYEITAVLDKYLSSYMTKVDSLILGCTHYPIIKELIQQVFLNKEYISSSESICQEVISYLTVHHMLNHQQKNGVVTIYTTGDVEEFSCSSQHFYNHDKKVEYLSIM